MRARPYRGTKPEDYYGGAKVDLEYGNGSFLVRVGYESHWMITRDYLFPTYEAGPEPGALLKVMEMETGCTYNGGHLLIPVDVTPHYQAMEAIELSEIGLGCQEEAVWMFYLDKGSGRTYRKIVVKIHPGISGITLVDDNSARDNLRGSSP